MIKIPAIITARGGSKGLPRKNITLLAGKPLIAYTIEAARQCRYIDECWVTTDDSEIKEVSLIWGAQVIDRPNKLATDRALSTDVLRHALGILSEFGRSFEFFALLQPTSPLRNAKHLDECIDRFLQEKACRSVISVVESDYSPYKSFAMQKGRLVPLFGAENLERPRQELPKTFNQNGAIYIAHTKLFLKFRSFAIPPVMPYIMDKDSSIDIDNKEDLVHARAIMRKWKSDER
jgi:CMP-N-acetylneuraminic acid synthetase